MAKALTAHGVHVPREVLHDPDGTYAALGIQHDANAAAGPKHWVEDRLFRARERAKEARKSRMHAGREAESTRFLEEFALQGRAPVPERSILAVEIRTLAELERYHGMDLEAMARDRHRNALQWSVRELKERFEALAVQREKLVGAREEA